MRRYLISVLVIAMLASLGALAFGQQPDDEDHADAPRASTWVQAPRVPRAPKPPYAYSVTVHNGHGHHHQKLSALADVWHSADSERDRKKVREIASDILSEQFEADLKEREEELAKIEARVDRLREQLRRRVDSKDEIIELQVKQMTMSWDGLGWEDSGSRGSGNYTVTGNLATARSLFSGGGGGSSDSMPSLIAGAVERDDDEQIEFLTSKMLAQTEEMEPEEVNNILWNLFEQTKDSIDSRAYWQALVEAGEEGLARYGDTREAANMMDTVAHLYEQLGDLDKAIEYQEKAVELSDGRFGNHSELQAYLEELKSAR